MIAQARIGPNVTPHDAIVSALARMPSACPTAEALADRLGRDVEAVWDALEAAERAGLVECWPDHPDAPSVTLTPLSAERLGVRLTADASRWIGAGDIDPTAIDRRMREVSETDASPGEPLGYPRLFAATADPGAIEAVDALAAIEDAPDRADSYAEALPDPAEYAAMSGMWRDWQDQKEHRSIPRPQLLLGIGRSWPVMAEGADPPRPWTPGDGPCPVCRGRRLGIIALCVVCLRSGVDHLLPPPGPPPGRKRPRPKSDGLKGGLG